MIKLSRNFLKDYVADPRLFNPNLVYILYRTKLSLELSKGYRLLNSYSLPIIFGIRGFLDD